ncbi:MsnO8 family LLM class oxidoreductase (plasmid) [Deinococcus sp. KNUC1210]|uniref:MsnO8 family LLM class oxidoreductase n=1 Tax=Deinococcus sp. KNUC1210 TaxID=2917691 RepID=UPI001EEFDA3F|nr:MsnO8 family LLM class oxidoreductase [Deinococcus sp. KNUC1210]ULH17460.1 MsnO8 family LLM class oxidoreductase [Deinococcus sp. KNUC1210]
MTVQLSILDPVPMVAGQRPDQALQAAVRLAQCADRLGYHRIWYAEHHLQAAAACPAPAVLVASVAAQTQRIRVGSGGVVLRHHAPWHVAETFSMLGSLYPGRIDLGVASGHGASEEVAARLGGGPIEGRLDALQDALQTLGTQVDAWVLGSSARSAQTAARLGWYYGSGNVVGDAAPLTQYRRDFSAVRHARPAVSLAVAVVCAENMPRALQLAASHRAYFSSQGTAPHGAPVPSPEHVLPLSGNALDLYPRLVVGDPATVRAALTALARRYDVDELLLLSVLHSAQDRLDSYALIADAMLNVSVPPARISAQPGGYL